MSEDVGLTAKSWMLGAAYAFSPITMCGGSKMVQVTFNDAPLMGIRVVSKGLVGSVACMLCPANEPFFEHVFEHTFQNPPLALGTSVAVKTAVDTAALTPEHKRQRTLSR